MDLISEVYKALKQYDSSGGRLKGNTVLACVSGGVDSMVMLDVLFRLSDELEYSLCAVTVNHNIRPAEESAGDAALVVEICRNKGIPCIVSELEKGEVEALARSRGKGIEEAARMLRYGAFQDAAKKTGASCICIAHNRNDRLETILQRFLQGAGINSSAGMKAQRDAYFRPLFNVSREQIESYAAGNSIEYRTDSTNLDDAYFRNRIRNRLIPFLDELEPGWDTAVIHGAEKNAVLAEEIEKSAENIIWTQKDCCCLETPEASFLSACFTVRMAGLYNALALLKCPKRIPYDMLAGFARGADKVSGAGIRLERKNGRILCSSFEGQEGDDGLSGFFLLISKPGNYTINGESVCVRQADSSDGRLFRAETEDGCVSGLFTLPVAVRNGSPSDFLRRSDGKTKLLSKIFSDWHVPHQDRNRIPVFQDSEVRGVWGSLLGYDDWFVKIQEKNNDC